MRYLLAVIAILALASAPALAREQVFVGRG